MVCDEREEHDGSGDLVVSRGVRLADLRQKIVGRSILVKFPALEYRLTSSSVNTQTVAVTMHLHVYRDENRAGHIDLVMGGAHPWTIDLVSAIAAAMMLVGFAGAIAAHLVH